MPKFLIKMLYLIIVLNILDAVLTYYGVFYIGIEEGNPFVRYLWSSSPLIFIFIKIILIPLLILYAIQKLKKVDFNIGEFNSVDKIIYSSIISIVLTINLIYLGVVLTWGYLII